MWVGVKLDGMLMISGIKLFLLMIVKFFWMLIRGFLYGGVGIKLCFLSICVF